MSDLFVQVIRVNVLWTLALVLVYGATFALRIRSPRTRYNVLWATYCLVFPATIISLIFRRTVVVSQQVSWIPATAAPDAGVSLSAVVFWCLAAVSLSGVAVFAVRWTALAANRRKLSPCADPRVGEIIEQLKPGIGVHTGVQCLLSPAVLSPCSWGIRPPIIVFGAGMLPRLDRTDLVHILAHELVHIRHHDFVRNLLQKFMRFTFLFNPAAWYFDRIIDTWREVACDRDVIDSPAVDRRQYAQMLLDMGIRLREQWAAIPTNALVTHRSNLPRRISLMRISNTHDGLVKGLALAALVTIAFVIIACSNTEEVTAPADNTSVSADQNVSQTDGKDLHFVFEMKGLDKPMTPKEAVEILHNADKHSKLELQAAKQLVQHRHSVENARNNVPFGPDDQQLNERKLIEFQEQAMQAMKEKELQAHFEEAQKGD